MMAKEPHGRFQTPRDLAVALAPFFKKPATAAMSPMLGVDRARALDGGHAASDTTQPGSDGIAAPALTPRVETDFRMWSSLIDFQDTGDDTDVATEDMKPVRQRTRWLWPAAAGGMPLCGLVAAWVAGVFNE